MAYRERLSFAIGDMEFTPKYSVASLSDVRIIFIGEGFTMLQFPCCLVRQVRKRLRDIIAESEGNEIRPGIGLADVEQEFENVGRRERRRGIKPLDRALDVARAPKKGLVRLIALVIGGVGRPVRAPFAVD